MAARTPLTDDVTFAITADTGELEVQSAALVRSLEDAVPNAEIVVFIPAASIDEMSDDTLALFRNAGTIVTGEIPIPEYPISALVQAFVEAERASSTEHLVALDTDTLVLNTPTRPNGGDVWLRPADVGAQYWGSAAAREDWTTLCNHFDVPAFDQAETLQASVDGRSIPPYWNSGVVITTDRTLPERWLEYTKTLFHADDLPVDGDEFFLDQLSLALAVRENDVRQLSEQQNYPLGGRLHVPSSVEVLHYGNRRNLARVLTPTVRSAIAQYGALPSVSAAETTRSVLDYLSSQSGRVLSYEQKEVVRQAVLRVLPESVADA